MAHPHDPTVSRRIAAELTGLAPATLKKWAGQRPQRGPACFKIGTTKQARTLYSVAEIARWKRDPAGYEAARRRGPTR